MKTEVALENKIGQQKSICANCETEKYFLNFFKTNK